jgi:hypothetical protein
VTPVLPLVLVALLAYGWWVTELRPFSWPALLAVEGAGVVAVVVGMRAGGRRRPAAATEATVTGETPPAAAEDRARARWPAGMSAWVVLVAVLAVLQLQAYVQHPRSEHPTLSLLIDHALSTQPVRVVAFAGWVVGAYGLARR